MKKFLSLLALMLPVMLMAQQTSINWMSIEEAVEAQKKQPKKIVIDVYTHWCGPCKMMMQNTFTNEDVIKYMNEHYYAVKFDAESPNDVNFKGVTYSNANYDPNRKGRNGVNDFARALGVNAYPTLVYMDEDLNIIAPIPGYQKPQQLELYLKFFAGNHYKTVTTQEQWQAWQASFAPQFRQ